MTELLAPSGPPAAEPVGRTHARQRPSALKRKDVRQREDSVLSGGRGHRGIRTVAFKGAERPFRDAGGRMAVPGGRAHGHRVSVWEASPADGRFSDRAQVLSATRLSPYKR